MNNTSIVVESDGSVILEKQKPNVNYDEICSVLMETCGDVSVYSLLKKIGYVCRPCICFHTNCDVWTHGDGCQYKENSLNGRALEVIYSPYKRSKLKEKHPLCFRDDCKGPYHVEVCKYHYDYFVDVSYDDEKCVPGCVGRLHIFGCGNNKQNYDFAIESSGATVCFDIFEEDFKFNVGQLIPVKNDDCLDCKDTFKEEVSDEFVIEAHVNTSSVVNQELNKVAELVISSDCLYQNDRYCNSFRQLAYMIRSILRNPVRAAVISHVWSDGYDLYTGVNESDKSKLKVVDMPKYPCAQFISPYVISLFWSQVNKVYNCTYHPNGLSRFNYNQRLGINMLVKKGSFDGCMPEFLFRMNLEGFKAVDKYVVTPTLCSMYMAYRFSLEHIYNGKKFKRVYYRDDIPILRSHYTFYRNFVYDVVTPSKPDAKFTADILKEDIFSYIVSRVVLDGDVQIMLERFSRCIPYRQMSVSYDSLFSLGCLPLSFDKHPYNWTRGARKCPIIPNKPDKKGVIKWLNHLSQVGDGCLLIVSPLSGCYNFCLHFMTWVESKKLKFVCVVPHDDARFIEMLFSDEYRAGSISLMVNGAQVLYRLFKWYNTFVYSCWLERQYYANLFRVNPFTFSWPSLTYLMFVEYDGCFSGM